MLKNFTFQSIPISLKFITIFLLVILISGFILLGPSYPDSCKECLDCLSTSLIIKIDKYKANGMCIGEITQFYQPIEASYTYDSKCKINGQGTGSFNPNNFVINLSNHWALRCPTRIEIKLKGYPNTNYNSQQDVDDCLEETNKCYFAACYLEIPYVKVPCLKSVVMHVEMPCVCPIF